MTTDQMLMALSAALCFAASGACGTHEILMDPQRPNYPTGRFRLRVLMFIWSGVLAFRAMEFAGLAAAPDCPAVSVGQVLGCFMVAAVHLTMLENHLRQWLPAKTHERIRRLLDVASCGRAAAWRAERERANAALWAGVKPGPARPSSAALAELSMRGSVVIGPNEAPAALYAQAEETLRLYQ